MSNQLQNICVFIEDEKQLQKARELLEGKGEHTAMRGGWCLADNKKYNYLQKCEYNGEWFLSEKFPSKLLITLTELEKLLEDA